MGATWRRVRRSAARLICGGLGWLCWSCAHDQPPHSEVWVHHLIIKGNKALSAGDLRDKLATQPTGWWPFASKRWFDPAALDLDLKRIPAFYADRGYFDARVVSHQTNL